MSLYSMIIIICIFVASFTLALIFETYYWVHRFALILESLVAYFLIVVIIT